MLKKKTGGGHASNRKTVTFGVPQGSVLLFDPYIFDS